MTRLAIAVVFGFICSACGDDGGNGGDVDGSAADSGAAIPDAPPPTPDATPPTPDATPPTPDATPPTPDANATSCLPNGVGDVTGTAAGVELDPITSAWLFDIGDGRHGLVVDERVAVCDFAPPADDATEHLVAVFCDAPTVGTTYTITDVFPETPCPGGTDVFAWLERGGGGDVADGEATGGTVTFTAVGDCVTGAFDLSFAQGALTGTFDAIVCGP